MGALKLRFGSESRAGLLPVELRGSLVTSSEEASDLLYVLLKFPSTMLSGIGTFINASLLFVAPVGAGGPPPRAVCPRMCRSTKQDRGRVEETLLGQRRGRPEAHSGGGQMGRKGG